MGRNGSGRESILTAARGVFSRKGYDGASIRDIAEEANLSLSALYYYFSNKEDVLFELVLSAFEQFLDGAREAAGGESDDPAVQLAALVRYTVRFRVVHAEVSRVIIQETWRLQAEKHAAVRVKQVESNDLFHDVVNSGVSKDVFRTPYPHDVVRAIVSMCNAISMWYKPGGKLTIDQLVDQYLDFAFRVVGHVGEIPALPERQDDLLTAK